MTVIYSMMTGCAVFAVIALSLGFWLRNHASEKVARITTGIVHAFIVIAVFIPATTGIVELSQLDACLGITSLPPGSPAGVLGVLMMLAGLGFLSISLVVLLDRGKGLPLFELSRELAAQSIYKYTRNPMSLGFYLLCIGAGILGGSTFFTLWSLLVLIPAHIVFLKYFEEYELEIRLGKPYREYKKNVPFLIPRYPVRDRSPGGRK